MSGFRRLLYRNWNSATCSGRYLEDFGDTCKTPEIDATIRSNRVAHFIPSSGDDIAAAVLYLVSDDAKYVTGHTLIVDGGWTAGYSRDW